DVPQKLHHLFSQHMMPGSTTVGLAIEDSAFHERKRSNHTNRLFAHLPLPITTAFPGHIYGSFILANDRCSIRFDYDEREDTEASYNKYLLSQIPKLFLSILVHRSDDGIPLHIWPSSSEDCLDIYAQIVASVLYKTLNEVRDHNDL